MKGPSCSGAWTGVVRYSRTQSQSDNKTVERVSGRGQDTRTWEMKYDYKANIAVREAPEKDGSSLGTASISHSFSSIEEVLGVERNSCDNGKTWREMSCRTNSKTAASASATVDANVGIGVNDDGTYTVSVGIPPIKGTLSGSQSGSCSGQCSPRESKNMTMSPVETSIDGNSMVSELQRMDPGDPTKLAGSSTLSNFGVTETLSWNLTKCGGELQLTDLRFEHPKFPDFGNWQEISENSSTIDGNMIKITATVLNASGDNRTAEVKLVETYKGDKWNGATPDKQMLSEPISVSLDPGEQQEIEFIWDSSGYAWFDDGRPRLVQRIRAELLENGKKVDEKTKNIRVAPKPVVLVHGLWSNWKAWESWQNILTTSHSYDWKAFPVGEKPEKGKMNTGTEFLSSGPTNSIFENSQELGKYIRYAQQDRNAWHVVIVAHSMGGLISRHYIHSFMPADSPDGRPQVSRLVMLGTPNEGSPCADVMDIAFGLTGRSVEAIRQLRPSVVAEFNRVHTNRKGVKFSVLAGNPLPVMCKTLVWNDGVVPVRSAIWQIKDSALSPRLHTELTGTHDFSGFVKPRLAIGPGGDHNPAAPEIAASNGYAPFRISNAAVSSFGITRGPSASEWNDGSAPFAKALKIPANGTVEIDVPVSSGPNLGLTFVADRAVGAVLLNASGASVGKNDPDTPESGGIFRSIFYDKPVAEGVWKLRLKNTSGVEREIVLATWKVE
ncbi:MAG: hypothetical protein DWQ47_07590 [Acidobacteria bacterium]|nr:MAG: hypothetical protein DWQ32_15690 [Acidobacteriota bacterium]REJ99215.1 MAG: hypothetical protein DWQ38_14285 [Acidobacteriota bacterium]REK16064.1 MAG: hypothetical protein DWQ43_03400 [Acidobacteriota bacterium]REK43745.1 MAG: hypothetical protein DWQ47_07590 [Acidobacteriota bacterium]